MTNPYTTPPMPPQPASGPTPRWARKRYVLPALGLVFFIGVGIGTGGEDTTTDAARPVSAKPVPTVTVTATTTETAEPEAAPTVTATKTVKVTKTVTAEPAEDTGSNSDDSGSGSDSGGSGSVYYSNCTEARAAGAAPVYRGDPGYGSHLDRDGDGVACE